MNTNITNEDLAGAMVKEAWIKPEVATLSVNQDTMGGFILGSDQDGGDAS
jgi:hypothetical protein